MNFISAVAYVEKTSSPDETILDAKAEPEPVYIDEVPPLFLVCRTKQTVSSEYLRIFSLLFLQGKMDRTLALLQNADPADPAPDAPELIQLEGKNS